MRGTTAARLGVRRGLVLRGLGAQAHRQHSDDTPLQPGGASMTDSNRVNTETKRWRPPPVTPSQPPSACPVNDSGARLL